MLQAYKQLQATGHTQISMGQVRVHTGIVHVFC